MSLPQSLADFIVDKPKPDSEWRSFGDPSSARLCVLHFADQAEQESAFADAGIVARDGETLPPDFSWSGIGNISVIGKVVDHPPVYGEVNGYPMITQEATFLPGWYVNILVPEPPADPAPGGPMPPETDDSKFMDGAEFLASVTDQEYATILAAAQQNVQIARWIEILRLRGVIDVKGRTALDAKAGLVAFGLLTAERAEVIFG